MSGQPFLCDRIRRRRLLGALTAFAFMLAGGQATAQPLRDLHGTIADATGTGIRGASVQLDDGHGHRTRTSTDDEGAYRFAGLPPAAFSVVVTATGFAPFTTTIDLGDPRTTPLNVVLQVLVTEEVTVVPQLSVPRDTGMFSLMLSGRELNDLPGGVGTLVQRLQEMTGTTGRPGDFALYVNGFRRGARIPPVGAIQSVRITWNPFAPEFGEPGVARVDIITKPGGADVHGEFTGTFGPKELNAPNAFLRAQTPDETREYQANIGGPLVKDRVSVSAYGGQWGLDTSSIVNARTLDTSMFAPTSTVQAVPTPSRVWSYWAGVDSVAGRGNLLALSYSETRDRGENQGLITGYELPEHAYLRTVRDQAAQLSWTATGKSALNDMKIGLSRHTVESSALGSTPAVQVLNAFYGGSDQDHFQTARRAGALEFSERLTIPHGRAMFKIGADVDAVATRDVNRSNFGGTFLFGSDVERDTLGQPVRDASGALVSISSLERYRRTVLGLPGYGPSQFTIVTGDPLAEYDQTFIGVFVQHDLTIGRRLNLLYGVREEYQSYVTNGVNLAPRVGLAWSLDAKSTSVIRASGGVFYSRLENEAIRDNKRFDGNHRQIVVQQPAFFPEVPVTLAGSAATTVVRRLANQLDAPRLIKGSVGYGLKSGVGNLSASYTFERGTRLLLGRNINAPVGGVQPFPDRGPILQYETSGRSQRHELLITFRTDSQKRVSVFGSYILSRLLSDTDGVVSPLFRDTDAVVLAPADSTNLAAEYGPGMTDRRHRGTLGASAALPLRFRITGFLTVMSGQPFNITTGRDNNGDTLFTDRPAFARPGDPGVIDTPFGAFNPAPGPGDQIVPRNYGREPMQIRLDARAEKMFPLTQSAGLAFTADVQNVLDRVNLLAVDGVLTSPNFGRANRALDPRRVTFAARISF